MNYCVLINKLSELMGDELIQLEKNNNKCTADNPVVDDKENPQFPYCA